MSWNDNGWQWCTYISELNKKTFINFFILLIRHTYTFTSHFAVVLCHIYEAPYQLTGLEPKVTSQPVSLLPYLSVLLASSWLLHFRLTPVTHHCLQHLQTLIFHPLLSPPPSLPTRHSLLNSLSHSSPVSTHIIIDSCFTNVIYPSFSTSRSTQLFFTNTSYH